MPDVGTVIIRRLHFVLVVVAVMKLLFRLATDRFTLDWYRVSQYDPAIIRSSNASIGRLRLIPQIKTLVWKDNTFRDGVPSALCVDPEVTLGPPLFEQTEYQVYLHANRPNDVIQIQHRDPLITKGLNSQEHGRVVHGNLNFRGQIGQSLFSILLNGQRVLDFEIEVFPTKIDYETDYQDMLADVQQTLTGLAFEYLRSTYQRGKVAPGQQPSKLEWLILFESIIHELEQALDYVTRRPTRALIRREQMLRIERVRRVNSSVRSQVCRGQGQGAMVSLRNVNVREKIKQSPPELTLDTLEHRWLKTQLTAVQRTLGQISKLYDPASPTNGRRSKDRGSRSLRNPIGASRQQATAHAITKLKSRVDRLQRLEPIAAAQGEPPPGFASLQLVSAAGYREAYRLLMLLRSGLRLEGELLSLSVKDLEVLYEYWVYLTIVGIFRDEFGPPLRLDHWFKLDSSRLSVQLRSGFEQQISFQAGAQRAIHVAYNPRFSNQDAMLIPQKPDILIRLEEDGWPILQLVVDAKYRIDATTDFRDQFGSFGPPRDAINALHRYRDAILEIDQSEIAGTSAKRSVVQAVAVFPLDEHSSASYRNSRLWQALQRLGVGAIPLLPSKMDLFREWLIGTVRMGGWALADRAISHAADQRAAVWRAAAREPVWIGVLRSPGASEHLEWIKRERCYYQPLAKTQPRQFAVNQVALYVPGEFGKPNNIGYGADVINLEIVERSQIKTPWLARRNGQMVLYRLGPVRRLPTVIPFCPGDYMPAQGRWTTRLGLERAKSINEVALETDAEWRLLEWLRANGIKYTLRAEPLKRQDPDNPQGRVWFQIGETRLRYDGPNGYLIRQQGFRDRYGTLAKVIAELTQ